MKSKKEIMKRILLQENASLLREISSDLNQYVPLLKEVKSSFELLELSPWSNDILKEIVLTGANGIEKRFTEHLANQIEKTQLTSSILKENILSGSKSLFQDFAQKVSLLKKFKPDTYSRQKYLKLNFISYENNIFYLSDENKEQILENECRVYLENKSELELYNDLTNLIEAYNKVTNNLNKLKFKFNFNHGRGMQGIENVFLKYNDNSFEVFPDSIKFAVNHYENRLRFNS